MTSSVVAGPGTQQWLVEKGCPWSFFLAHPGFVFVPHEPSVLSRWLLSYLVREEKEHLQELGLPGVRPDRLSHSAKLSLRHLWSSRGVSCLTGPFKPTVVNAGEETQLEQRGGSTQRLLFCLSLAGITAITLQKPLSNTWSKCSLPPPQEFSGKRRADTPLPVKPDQKASIPFQKTLTKHLLQATLWMFAEFMEL